MSPPQDDLFGAGPLLPEGMRYEEEFLSRAEEAELVGRIEKLPLAPMQYQQYEARRRVVYYGGKYDFTAQKLEQAEPLPDWLDSLRERAAAWTGGTPDRFTQALVAEYAPGTPLGWHRDVPDYEDIVGVSLLNEAVLKFRPYPHVVGRKAEVRKLVVAPRSIYLLRGPSRWDWQHSVPPAKRCGIRLPCGRRGGA
jgi:alkylated DNA repair dioxygenase AlkB